MLIIFNPKAIYGTEIPSLVGLIRRAGYKVAILGSPLDQSDGDLFRAELILNPDAQIVAEFDTPESLQMAMIELMGYFKAAAENTWLISQEPRDLAAADLLNVPAISPFQFGEFIHRLLKETEGVKPDGV